MIPYDDLVAALANWRAKQGLPAAGGPGGAATAVSTPTFSAAPAAAAPAANSGKSGSGPKRAAPPAAPPPSSGKAPGSGKTAAPAPLAPPDETIDVDDHEHELAVEDHAVETVDEGEFNSAFGNLTGEVEGESTSIGSAPGPRDSFGGATMPAGPAKGPTRNNDDW